MQGSPVENASSFHKGAADLDFRLISRFPHPPSAYSSRSRRTAAQPICRLYTRMVVRGGSEMAQKGRSSKPTTETSSGTRNARLLQSPHRAQGDHVVIREKMPWAASAFSEAPPPCPRRPPPCLGRSRKIMLRAGTESPFSWSALRYPSPNGNKSS